MRILALDLASHVSGMCCGTGADVPIVMAWEHPEVTTKAGADHGLLLESLDLYLETAFRRWPDIGCIGFEAPILVTKGKNRKYGDKLSTLRLLYPMSAYVELYARRRQIPVHEIQPKEAKAEVTGKANAPKEDVAYVAEKCGVKLPVIGRLDCGDSWAVWKRLLRYYDPEQSARWDAMIYGSHPT